MKNRRNTLALCAAVSAAAMAVTLISTLPQTALAAGGGGGAGGRGGAGGGRGGAGGGGAPQPTLKIDTSKWDSSKSKMLPTVYAEENTGAKLPRPKLPAENDVTPIKPFPDPFAWVSDQLGKTRSTDFKDWEAHRQEMMAMIEKYEIGPKPVVDVATQVTATWTPNTPPASAPAAGAMIEPAGPDVFGFGGGGGGGGGGFGGAGGGRGRGGGGGPGGTMAVTVKVKDQSFTLNCAISIPANAKAPYPVIIGIGGGSGSLPGNEFSSRGIATVAYNNNSVTQDGRPTANDAFYKLYPEIEFSTTQKKGSAGQYAAWAWGASRVIDGLELIKDKFPVDMNHIAITGCSRNGKLALFAGAFDERIAVTVAQESGGGGATNWRFSETEPMDPQNPNKKSVEGITNTDHAWFASQMFGYGGDKIAMLPEDHHMLTSLCAPRALYVTGNTDYTWLSNKSLYVNSMATSKVYSTLGIADRFGFVVNGGHAHCGFPASQLPELTYFLDRFMKDQKDLSQYVTTVPEAFASVDADRWTQWWGTGKADLPPAK